MVPMVGVDKKYSHATNFEELLKWLRNRDSSAANAGI